MTVGMCRTGALVETVLNVSTATTVLQGGLVSGENVLSQTQEPRVQVGVPLVAGTTG